MSLMSDPPFGLGKTFGTTSATEGLNWEGCVKDFPDVNPVTGAVRSNRVKKCICVRNSSGQTLKAKRAVAWTSGSYKTVAGFTRITNDDCAGVVDEWLPSTGVAANDLFWITVDGPSEYYVSQTVAVGDVVAAVTAHTTNGTDSAGTGGYGATVSVTVAPQRGRVGKVISGTTGTPVVLVGGI
jgi:hypothetical protein